MAILKSLLNTSNKGHYELKVPRLVKDINLLVTAATRFPVLGIISYA